MEKGTGKENKNLAVSVVKIEESAAAAALLLFLSRHSFTLSLPSPPRIFSSNLKEKVKQSSIYSEETSASSCISDACSASVCEDPLKFLASAAVDRIFVGYKVVKKCRSKLQQQKKIIHNIEKMRVVYDLLKSGDERTENYDDSTIFSLPDSTSAPRNLRTKTSGDDTTAHVTFDYSPSPSAISTTPRSSTKRTIRKKYKETNSISSGDSRCRYSTKTATVNRSILRRADDILNWLSVNGAASEVMIRSFAGDTPDTSKALRLLVKRNEVLRTGVGGRTNPYLYMVESKVAVQI